MEKEQRERKGKKRIEGSSNDLTDNSSTSSDNSGTKEQIFKKTKTPKRTFKITSKAKRLGSSYDNPVEVTEPVFNSPHEYVVVKRSFIITDEAKQRGTYSNRDEEKEHIFSIPYGYGVLGKEEVTYFLPRNKADFDELTRWYMESYDLDSTMRTREFRRVSNTEFPILITEKVSETVVSYIERNLVGKSAQWDVMKVIRILSRIFISLTKANKARYRCSLKNIFIGEDGLIFPFVKLNSNLDLDLDVYLESIFKHLVNETYAKGGTVESIDLQLLRDNLFKNSPTPGLLHLFKSKPCPLSDPGAIETFLLMNTTYAKYGSEVDIGAEMLKLLGPPPPATSESRLSNYLHRNSPMDFVHLSKNLSHHKTTRDKKDKYEDIRHLKSSDLFDHLYSLYPGVFTAFYITMCNFEAERITLIV